MGTISDKLMRIINTKEDIRKALISKGYDVPTSVPFKEYAKMILDLPCKVDSFPDIEGIVARYSASGLTNEQMAANPVWVDKTGNGYDLQLKNFSWKGMSGVGGYVADIDEWGTNSTAAYFERNSIKITATFKENASLGLLYHNIKLRQSCVLKVTGIPEGCDAFLDDRLGNRFYMSEDGVYEIIPSNFLAEALYLSIEKYPERWYGSKLTIEQLPLYPGALVFDGVDDYGVCDNFPILNAISAIATNASDQSFNGAFTFENYNKGAEQTISYGATQISLQYSKSPFSWQTTSKYNGFNIANGNKDATNSLVLGRSYPQRNEFANFAIWELVFLDHDATEEELTKIKDYFVKTYPWLFPDQAWTVTGKTNEDEDRATIANITGNGNDLVLSNFGFAKGSGYGLYNAAFSSKSNLQYWSKQKIQFSKSQIETNRVLPYLIIECKDELSYNIKIKMTGFDSGVKLKWGFTDGYTYIEGDGIHVLNKKSTTIRLLHIEYSEDFDPDHVVTIEQIPEYEGYLVTDGVDDKIVSSVFGMGKDFTIVGDWKFIDNKKDGIGLVKGSSFYIYNTMIGLDLYINSGSVKNSLDGIKSINAACSDGRAYDRNWNEILANTGNVVGSGGTLEVSSSGGRFDRIAFKNLAIYPRILSKDDCIKAYNYLQTLKSK